MLKLAIIFGFSSGLEANATTVTPYDEGKCYKIYEDAVSLY